MSEQDLVNSVVDYITRIGGVATRVNSGMFTIEGDDGKRRMVRGAPAGTSDVIACIRGKYWAIECKVGRNEPTVLQRDFLDRVADAGGMAIVVYDIDTLIQVVGAGWGATMTVELHLGDCLEVMRTLPDKSVDAVITDPPYGIGDIWKGGSSHGWGVASLATPKRNEWDKKPDKNIFDEILRVANKVIIWGGNYFELPISRGWLVWTKPERNFTLSEAELAWTNIPMPMRVIEHRRSDPGREHPTQKPLGVMKWSIEKARLPESATILDPFMGSGTTGVACVQTGRNFIGIEIDPDYYAIAERRIKEAQQQPTLFEAQP